MKFEVVQQSGAWIVRCDGVELGRYAEQAYALSDVSERLRAVEPAEGAVSLAMRYEARDQG
jgi:hypothetical protein